MSPPLQWAVVMVNLDPVEGSEQRGTRPVLVVSNEAFNRVVPNVTVIPATSSTRSLYPAEIKLSKGTAGLSKDSILMAHQIRTISQRRLGRILGYVMDPRDRRVIQEAIADHLDLA